MAQEDKQSAMLQRAENRARKEQEPEGVQTHGTGGQAVSNVTIGREQGTNKGTGAGGAQSQGTGGQASSNITTGREKEGTKGTEAYQRA